MAEVNVVQTTEKAELDDAIIYVDDCIYWGCKAYQVDNRTKAWEIVKNALQKYIKAERGHNER